MKADCYCCEVDCDQNKDMSERHHLNGFRKRKLSALYQDADGRRQRISRNRRKAQIRIPVPIDSAPASTPPITPIKANRQAATVKIRTARRMVRVVNKDTRKATAFTSFDKRCRAALRARSEVRMTLVGYIMGVTESFVTTSFV